MRELRPGEAIVAAENAQVTVLRSCPMTRSHAAVAGELAAAVRRSFGLS